MLTSDEYLVISLRDFYHNEIYSPMKNRWLSDGRLDFSDSESIIHFERETLASLSDLVKGEFDFKNNEDMLRYFSETAIKDELGNKTRSFFVIDAQDSGKLLGAFSLALKVVKLDNLSSGSRKKLLLNSKRSAAKHITEIPVILIAQFGKNCNFPQSITGIKLMSLVLKQVEKARSIVGGQTIVLDSVNNEKVIAFYERFGFVKYGTIVNDEEASYQPMALDLSKLNL